MKEFLLGCNYWASNAGADMWRCWEEETVEKDLRVLEENGVNCLRVFPNWRDFQPVKILYGEKGREKDLCMEDGSWPSNRFYLDEKMMERFRKFCRMAEAHRMKLIVGLLTGWMSGRLYIPTALNEKNLFRDTKALKLAQLFVAGMVQALREEKAIYAWDLGNECNCMSEAASEEEAYSWTMMIANAIRAEDKKRPVISGMHSLELEGIWNIQDQGEITDVLTTHPYPLWVPHCSIDPVCSFRTLLHATIQTEYYRSIGKKPCLVEEIGTMGPMICDEETAAGFLRVNLYSNWIHGAPGVLWWCANEQSHLTQPPYEWNMCERELGMLDRNHRPKPVLREMKSFAGFLKEWKIRLPERQVDGTCVLTRGQDHWGVAYMAGLLAKQAGVTMDFAFCGQELPDRKVYLLPSLQFNCMYRSEYERLKEKVAAGATLYISLDQAFLTEFEELTGLRVEYSGQTAGEGSFELLRASGETERITLSYRRSYTYRLRAIRAEVLAADEEGYPLFTKAAFGRGQVYVLNFPVETMLLPMGNAFMGGHREIYRRVFEESLLEKPLRTEQEALGITIHPESENSVYAAVINYSPDSVPLNLKPGAGWRITETLLGDERKMEPYGAGIYHLDRKRMEEEN